jgi:hypothetical protein
MFSSSFEVTAYTVQVARYRCELGNSQRPFAIQAAVKPLGRSFGISRMTVPGLAVSDMAYQEAFLTPGISPL